MRTTKPEGLLTVKQAAAFLHCGVKKIYELAKADKIKLVKVGHSTRITEASLHRMIGELPRADVRGSDPFERAVHAELIAMREELRSMRAELRSMREWRWVISPQAPGLG